MAQQRSRPIRPGAAAPLGDFTGDAELVQPTTDSCRKNPVTTTAAMPTALAAAAFEHAEVGLLVLNPDGSVLIANETAAVMLGHPTLLGTNLANHFADGSMRHLITRLRTGASTSEHSHFGHNECELFLQLSVATVDGAAVIAVTIRDVTSEKHASDDADRTRRRLKRVFDYAPIPLQFESFTATVEAMDQLRRTGVTDIRTHLASHPEDVARLLKGATVLMANPASIEHLRDRGFLDDEVPEVQTLDGRITEATLATLVGELDAIWRGETRLTMEIEEFSRNGEPRWTLLHWNVPESGGLPDFEEVITVAQDITELRSSQRLLEAHLASKDRFVASVAHELRTPLTAVVGLANTLTEENVTPEMVSELVPMIAMQSNELASLIDDLLVIARGDLSDVQVISEPVELSQLVVATSRGHQWNDQVVIDVDHVVALGDPVRLRQVLRNLVTNAMRYGGKRITIRTGESDGIAKLEVADNGAPIPEIDRDRLFLAYQRLEGTGITSGSVGLGSTVARTLVNIMSGDLTLIREEDENVFRITLPLAIV